jgi:hypothetical protein
MNKVRPAKRLVETSAKCSKEGALYGQCILNNYQTLGHNTCDKEFVAFKQCITKHIGKKW